MRPREQAEWPRRLEKLCREAEAHWRAARPWVADPNMCVSVPIPRLDLPDPPRSAVMSVEEPIDNLWQNK